MHRRFLTIIRNEKGMEEYNLGIEKSLNMEIVELPEEEFNRIFKNGLFEKMNSNYNLMIDDFESEVVHKEEIEDFLKNEDILKLLVMNPVMKSAFMEVLKEGIALAMDF